MGDGYNKAVVLQNNNTKKAFKDIGQHDCSGGDLGASQIIKMEI